MGDGTDVDSAPQGGLPPPAIVYHLTVTQITSYLVIAFRKDFNRVGSVEDLEAFYKKVLVHNLLFGFWSFPFGPIWTPMAMSRNRDARALLRKIVASGTNPPGWKPDPTGHHPARYWDGQAWTDQVSGDVTSDPV